MNARNPQQNAQWNTRRLAVTPCGVGVVTNRYTECAENAPFQDVEGQRYVDFTVGIAAVNTGHRHPRLVQAMREQLDHFARIAFQIMSYGSCVELAGRLNTITPGTHARKTAFFTTGAEAVENAVKIARAHTGRPGVIVLTGALHGRTFMGMSLMGKVVPYETDFGPFPGSIYHVPTPVALHGMSTQDALDAIQRLFKADIDPRQVAAIIFGPVQGEGDFYQMSANFMHTVQALCDEHGIVMIADEVRTGLARTGKLFAIGHTGVLPDVTTMAKGLTGNLLLSAVTGRAEIVDTPAPGGLDGTYTGNPLTVASAHAVLDIIAGEELCECSAVLDTRLVGTLNAAKAKRPRIAEVRGVGAMIAVEFSTPDGKPDADFIKLIQQWAFEADLLLLSCDVYSNMIRFLFPFTAEDTVFEEGLAVLQRALGG